MSQETHVVYVDAVVAIVAVKGRVAVRAPTAVGKTPRAVVVLVAPCGAKWRIPHTFGQVCWEQRKGLVHVRAIKRLSSVHQPRTTGMKISAAAAILQMGAAILRRRRSDTADRTCVASTDLDM